MSKTLTHFLRGHRRCRSSLWILFSLSSLLPLHSCLRACVVDDVRRCATKKSNGGRGWGMGGGLLHGLHGARLNAVLFFFDSFISTIYHIDYSRKYSYHGALFCCFVSTTTPAERQVAVQQYTYRVRCCCVQMPHTQRLRLALCWRSESHEESRTTQALGACSRNRSSSSSS